MGGEIASAPTMNTKEVHSIIKSDQMLVLSGNTAVNMRDYLTENSNGVQVYTMPNNMVIYVENGKINRIIIADFTDISFDGFTFEATDSDETVIKAIVGEQIIADAEGNATIVEIVDTITVKDASASVIVGGSTIYTAISGLEKTHEWEHITVDGLYENVFHWNYEGNTYLVAEGDPEAMASGATFHAFKLVGDDVAMGYLVRKDVVSVPDYSNGGN